MKRKRFPELIKPAHSEKFGAIYPSRDWKPTAAQLHKLFGSPSYVTAGEIEHHLGKLYPRYCDGCLVDHQLAAQPKLRADLAEYGTIDASFLKRQKQQRRNMPDAKAVALRTWFEKLQDFHNQANRRQIENEPNPEIRKWLLKFYKPIGAPRRPLNSKGKPALGHNKQNTGPHERWADREALEGMLAIANRLSGNKPLGASASGIDGKARGRWQQAVELFLKVADPSRPKDQPDQPEITAFWRTFPTRKMYRDHFPAR